MINNISEGTLRVTTKIDPSAAIHDKEVHQQKEKEIAEARPVESSEAGQDAQKKRREDDQGSSRFFQGERTMVYEKYNKNGDLILRLPPSENPVDKKV